MKRLISLLVSLLLLATGCGDDGPVEGVLEAVGLSENVDVEAPPAPATADDIVARLQADGFNGIVLIDHAGGLRTHSLGSADGPDGPPIDENTVFDIGSITKQFTGAAILRLEMDGRLSVDDPVGAHLAGLDPALADLTLHQLLTHTAGLPDGIGDDYEAIEQAEFLERAADRVGETGEYRYSNVGYSLLGMTIESVTGQSYEAYLRDAFFDPLGMDATGYVLPDYDTTVVAAGYDGDTRLGLPNEQPWAVDGPYWHLRANGGLLSSAADMRRWSDALDGDAVLSAEARAKLFDRHVEEGDGAGSFYGYGWVSFPDGSGGWFHGHNGGNGIFFADILRIPDDDLLVFVASNTAGADEDAAFRIAETLVDGGVGADCLPPIDATAFPVAESFPEGAAGATAAAMVEIMLEGGDGDRREFAERHVSPQLGQGLSVDELAGEIARIQEEFVGYTVDMIHVEDARRTHVLLGASDGATTLVSVVVDADDPELVACLQIEPQ